MKKVILLLVLLFGSTAFAKIEMSGTVAIQAKTGKDTYYSDNVNLIDVREAALTFEAQINNEITGTIAFWADQTNIDDVTEYSLVDEVYITHNFKNGYVKVGQSYLPFGDLSTNFIGYANTYNYGSVQARMAEVGYDMSGFSIKAYAMNSDYVKAGDKTGLNTYGAFAGYEHKNFSIGLSYLSNASNLGWVGAHDSSFDTKTEVKKVVAAYGAYVTANIENFSFLAEYLTTAEKLNKEDYFYYSDKAVQPSVANIELAYTLPYNGKDLTIAVGYQANNKIVDITAGTPSTMHKRNEDYYLVGANYEIKKDTIISFDNKMGSKDSDNFTTVAYRINF